MCDSHEFHDHAGDVFDAELEGTIETPDGLTVTISVQVNDLAGAADVVTEDINDFFRTYAEGLAEADGSNFILDQTLEVINTNALQSAVGF